MATCDMKKDCASPVTHIGEKGYVYCADHAKQRRHYVGERCRKMRVWELKLIAEGRPLPSYKPIRKPLTQELAKQEGHQHEIHS